MCVCVCVSRSLPATFSSKCSETAMAMNRAASTYAVPSYNATPDLSVKGVPPSLLSPEGSRLDGRLPHECRPACLCPPPPVLPLIDKHVFLGGSQFLQTTAFCFTFLTCFASSEDRKLARLGFVLWSFFGLLRVCVNFDTNVSTDMKTGAVNAAAGSAYAEFGQTKVIVSV